MLVEFSKGKILFQNNMRRVDSKCLEYAKGRFHMLGIFQRLFHILLEGWRKFLGSHLVFILLIFHFGERLVERCEYREKLGYEQSWR